MIKTVNNDELLSIRTFKSMNSVFELNFGCSFTPPIIMILNWCQEITYTKIPWQSSTLFGTVSIWFPVRKITHAYCEKLKGNTVPWTVGDVCQESELEFQKGCKPHFTDCIKAHCAWCARDWSWLLQSKYKFIAELLRSHFELKLAVWSSF